MQKDRLKVLEILRKYTFNDNVWEGYNDDFHVTKDLKINSARMVDIVLDLEESFGIQISDEELNQLNSVNDILNLLRNK
ncbi:MAG TPA: acyl carrier protein [Bacteroidales bacterium]|nr:acyl carrier protein [Bacteroidales bacterium]HQL70798.1 acyl carrier protein [Bacteroidales bacterium]